MNAVFSQDTRLGKLTTVLGQDVLVLLRFKGSDHVSALFDYSVECLSTQPNIDFDSIIGTHATVEIASQNDGPRYFDGIVTQAKWAGAGENGHKYELRLQPWFWLADRRRNQRIFHDMTAVQIIEKLLLPYASLGNPAVKVTLLQDYPVLEYTVQYRESDMAFACRLMERFGISYHFVHQDGNHTLVLTDQAVSHDAVAGGSRLYKPYDGHHNAEYEHFWEWHPTRRLTTGAMRLADYNFKTPYAGMEADRTGEAAYVHGQIESYDYPGDYLDLGQGDDVVDLRLRQERGQDVRHRAVGDCTSLGAGMTLTLTGDHVDGVNGEEYLCLSATHNFISQAFGSGDTEADGYAYSGEYVLMPVSAPMVPERKTRVPVVQGPQTAMVVGEGEIDCDEYGRIKVHFHWDLEKAYSMRCRVSQNWASKGWGGMVIPRIGMEVVVEFLEGDPDKPLVTGCVYNGANDVPYVLPQHKTRSTFKTDSHQSPYDGFNELRFEDEKFREEVFLRAQKDLSVKVQNDETRIVDENSVQYVGDTLATAVGRDRYSETNGRTIEYVGPPKHPAVGVRAARKVTDNLQRFAEGLVDLAKGAGRWSVTTLIKGHRSTYIGGDETKQVGGKYGKQIDGTYNVNVKSNIDMHSKHTLRLEAAKHLELTAGSSLTLSCGKGRLVLKKDGSIRVFGTDIDVVGENSVELDGGRIVQIDTPASSVDITDGKVSISSARIELN